MDVDSLAAHIAEAMIRAGSDTVFGLPGGGNNLAVIGACEAAGMRFVLSHTESAAAVMAGTYAQLTGAPALCVVTRGPGAASAVNGCAQAMLDRQPVIMLTDCVSSADRPRVSHQWLDQAALFAPVVKWSGVLGDGDPRLALDSALALATRVPAGPVHLDFDPTAATSPPPEVPTVGEGDITSLAARLGSCTRPVVLLGVGALAARDAVRSLVAGRNVPVLTTYKARGLVPDSAPNFAGVLTGATIESPVIEAADLILAIGLDPVELIPAPWPYRAPLISLSEWPAEVDAFTASLEIVGTLDTLIACAADSLVDEWEAGAAAGFRTQALAELAEGDRDLSPYYVAQRAAALSPAGSVATVDSGAHMLVVMPTWHAEEPGDLLISSGLATMGFALPAAIAASLARPGRRIVCFVGDGGLGMTLAELETIARLQLDVTVVVLNDSTLSLIAVKQRPHGQGDRRAVGYRETDFAGIARACGVEASTVTDRSELDSTFREAVSRPGPWLLDVRIDPSSYPRIYSAIRGPRTV
jgi:acetolactate synthase-1/2/3 large subunit